MLHRLFARIYPKVGPQEYTASEKVIGWFAITMMAAATLAGVIHLAIFILEGGYLR